jgi:hypothetical protein
MLRKLILSILIIVVVAGCRHKPADTLAEISDKSGKIVSEMYLKKDTLTFFWKIREIAGRGTIMVHEGILGEPGRKFEVSGKDHQELVQKITAMYKEMTDKGYRVFKPEAYAHLIIQTDTTSWGSLHDLDKLAMVEDLLNNALETTGNGSCTGSDIGSKVSFYSVVFDPGIAVQTMLKTLREGGMDFPVVIAIEKGNDIQVIWPENFRGEFSLL